MVPSVNHFMGSLSCKWVPPGQFRYIHPVNGYFWSCKQVPFWLLGEPYLARRSVNMGQNSMILLKTTIYERIGFLELSIHLIIDTRFALEFKPSCKQVLIGGSLWIYNP